MLPLLTLLTAQAAPIDYDTALSQALERNAGYLGADIGVQRAEGWLQSSRGIFDPWLSLSGFQNKSIEQGRYQGIPYTADSTTLGWHSAIAQTLSTGTSWSLDFDNSRSDSETEFEISGTAVTDQAEAAFNSRLTASLSQQLLQGHRMAYNLQNVHAAEQALSMAEATRSGARQDTLANTAMAYWDLYAARRAEQTAVQAVTVAQEEQRIVDAQVEAGNMAPIEKTRMAAVIAQAELSLMEAQMAAGAASDALALLLGHPLADPLEPTTEPGGVPMGLTLEVERVIEAALMGNPGLTVQRVALEGAQLDLANARHARLPTLSITGSYGLSGYELGAGYAGAFSEMTSGDFRNRYLGADFSAPLGGRAERGAVKSTSGAVLQAELDLAVAERAIASQVTSLVRTIEDANKRLELAALNLRLTEETLTAEKARQSVGRAIQKDVLEAQRARDEAEAGVVSARVAFRKAIVQLEALQGSL